MRCHRAPALAALFVVGCAFDTRGLPAAGSIDAHVSVPADARVDATVDATVDADPCPTGYAPIAGGQTRSQYRAVTAATDWLTAEKDCEDDGLAHLVVLDGDSERDAVRAVVNGDTWLGVSDRVAEGTFFKVTTGVATYLPWLSGEPNDQFGEDCVELSGGGFNDEGCDNGDAYVCECDGLAASPVAYTPP